LEEVTKGEETGSARDDHTINRRNRGGSRS